MQEHRRQIALLKSFLYHNVQSKGVKKIVVHEYVIVPGYGMQLATSQIFCEALHHVFLC